MSHSYLKWGDWNVICDVCGFKYKASELRKRWDGLMVCDADFELRHPQDFLRVRGDQPAVPWARPEANDTYVKVCYIWGQSAYADLAEADCARADNAPMPYQALYDLKYTISPLKDPIYYTSAIPGYAIPAYSLPGNSTEGI